MEKDKENQEVKHSDWKCFIGLHKYEIVKELDVVDIYNHPAGKIIISRCTNCGKIDKTSIKTVSIS